jgi:hypothetical protein
LWPAPASAALLDEVAGTVEGVTAPLKETVETVVPPPPTPPSSAVPAPVVKVPPVKLPQAPVKVPVPAPAKSTDTVPAAVETATNTVEAVRGTVTEVAGAAVSSSGGEATGTVEAAAASAAATVEQTASAGTAAAAEVLGTRATAAGPGSQNAAATTGAAAADTPGAVGGDGAQGALPADPDPAAVTGERPALLANAPARLLDPFIRVWPAVALTFDGPLGHYVRDLPVSVLALLEADRVASLRGDTAPLASSPPASDESVESSQPAFSWIPRPSLAPFDWVAGESAFLVLALLIALATATLAILGLARRELGMPMFRRGNRFPWRH